MSEMNRSALILKLLTSQKYGSMVASPTFSLPEVIGGERNWDYRYNWIRDSAFMVYALIRLGFTSEANDYLDWVCRYVEELNPDGSMQIMYKLDGGMVMEERVLDHLEGYRGSSPVRVGNQAFQQLQLDIYGELLDAVYLVNKYGNPISQGLWDRVKKMVSFVIDHWDLPDEGIWETRGGKRHFLFSRLMCWVAVDRALRLAEKRSFPAPDQKWRNVRDQIYQDIYENFWDEERGAFLQSKEGSALDASSLLMPLVRFISPTDPQWLSHLEAIEEELVYDSLVYRYSSEVSPDGLEGKEGTFSICTFWYVECLSRAGQLQKARFYFEKMLGYANHLGLYAEELSPQAQNLGNFPQAFTHLALISAAYDLNRRLNKEV
jgi:GH15 family glucan-1,4-alpha-glucosidase